MLLFTYSLLLVSLFIAEVCHKIPMFRLTHFSRSALQQTINLYSNSNTDATKNTYILYIDLLWSYSEINKCHLFHSQICAIFNIHIYTVHYNGRLYIHGRGKWAVPKVRAARNAKMFQYRSLGRYVDKCIHMLTTRQERESKQSIILFYRLMKCTLITNMLPTLTDHQH